MRKGSSAAPTVLETIRLNLTVFERAVAAGDPNTATRSINAAELMFKGLRDVASGAGCDVGQCPATGPVAEALQPEQQKPPVEPAEPKSADGWLLPGTYDFVRPETRPTTWVSVGDVEAMIARAFDRRVAPAAGCAWIGRVERREWSFGVLARLTWTWVCCAAALVWRGVRRVFGGRRG